MIDLNDREKKLEEALSKETKETLTDFVSMKRNKVKDTAEKMQLEIMDEFSEWLAKEEYVLGHLSSTWRKRVNDPPISMSVLYQMFLDNKKTN